MSLIDKVLVDVRRQLPCEQYAPASIFVREFYTDIAEQDFINRDVRDLSGAVLFHWRLMYRLGNERKLKVINPTLSSHGWRSKNTVIVLVQKDMPFLVNSLKMELNRLGYDIKLVVHLGGIKIKRQHDRIVQVIPVKATGDDSLAEAPIYIEIARQADAALVQVQRSLIHVLKDVAIAVKDHKEMVAIAAKISQKVARHKNKMAGETYAFLRWMMEGNFNFLGYGYYQLQGRTALFLSSRSCLGLARHKNIALPRIHLRTLAHKLFVLLLSPQPLLMVKLNVVSTVHRADYIDLIAVKEFDVAGRLVGVHSFFGLYGTMAYHSSVRCIPILRDKTAQILQRFGYPVNGYAAKTLLHILEELPRDDFIQASRDELYRISTDIFHLHGKRETRLFVLPDVCSNYVSCLVYVPRDNFNTDLRIKIQEILIRVFAARGIIFNVSFTDPILTRIHFMVRLGQKVAVNLQKLEAEITKVSRSWHDELQEELLNCGTGWQELGKHYVHAFPAGYCETFAPAIAAADVMQIVQLNDKHALRAEFYVHDVSCNVLALKLFSLKVLQLSDVLPVLENLGLKVISEQSYVIQAPDGLVVYLSYLQVIFMGELKDLVAVRAKFITTLYQALQGEIENDGFNRLVLSAGFTWREALLFRAYAKYLQQIKFSFSQQYLELVLSRHANIAQLLLKFFVLRFAPNLTPTSVAALSQLEKSFVQAVDAVTSLEEDRVLRQFFALIKATVRTSYYTDYSYLALKFACNLIPDLPPPCPLFEIFVYAVHFEGVHLRMARVARGGIRWSDRRDDFRTEILGLMKAQQVKNVVIVPYGAKGGFVIKRMQNDTENSAILCYQDFIRGLLSVTDNIIGGGVTHPKNVIFYDEEDPYLVVAADKGTANFSDIANRIAREHRFWLDDAFASGGKTGYNHKEIGITARGAWESVKHHFAAAGINGNFTVVGIGDMSGDVFGNGMLLSPHIKLIGAFDHRHIFLDPHPHVAQSYRERRRLFKLAYSSWADYNKKFISQGGGVFSRTAKAINISAEMQQVLGIKKTMLSPHELISALLTAPVDLLWNGGIGTYVKASGESHQEVGDKNNDAVRVNACDLKCKVIAEGGNLGLTQLARIEYALHGGLIHTDFIDNSGGVNCSDHEVNIKILLNELIRRKKLASSRRNALLRSMTEEVADLVLCNNTYQAQAIALIVKHSVHNVNLFGSYIKAYVNAKKLNRELEFLPSERALAERKAANLGLTSPEIAVLLSYSKIFLKEEILRSGLPEVPYFRQFLQTAFPQKLQRYRTHFMHHRLRREIISTELSNDFTTLMGAVFIYEMQQETDVTVPEVLHAYAIALEIFSIRDLLRQIEELSRINFTLKQQLLFDVHSILRRTIKWLLRNRLSLTAIEKVTKSFKKKITLFSDNWEQLVVGQELQALREKFTVLVKELPLALARIPILSRTVDSALNLGKIVNDKNTDFYRTAHAYFAVREQLGFFWLFNCLDEKMAINNWESAAKYNLRRNLDAWQRKFTILVLKRARKGSINTIFNHWLSQNSNFYQHWQQTLFEIKQADVKEFAIIHMVGVELLGLAEKFFSF